MSSQGWIKLHRSICEWEWYDHVPTKVLFIHCLLKANHKEKKWRGKTIERGSFITSRSNLSEETGLSVQQVRTALDKLELTNELTSETTNQYTHISINSYDDYQQINQQDNHQSTNGQPADNHQITTTKNEKNVKNEKNKIATPPSFNEVKEYFKKKGYPVSLAEKFYTYYQEPMEDRNGRVWKDSKGNTVKSWKQKAIAVWFNEEEKKDNDSDLSLAELHKKGMNQDE